MVDPQIQKLERRDVLSTEERAVLESLASDGRSYRVGGVIVHEDEPLEPSCLLVEGFAPRDLSLQKEGR